MKDKARGYFISIEGTDGSGKSSQLKKIIEYLKEQEFDLVITREPGGTMLGEKIREILLSPEHTSMHDRTEMLLYAACRAQHMEEKILPALNQGKIVITDRFIDSSIAYQGYGRNLGVMVDIINQFATNAVKPDLTIFLDLPPQLGIDRKKTETKHTIDRMEAEDMSFHQKVYQGYLDICNRDKDRVKRVDASRPLEDVFQDIKNILDTFFDSRKIDSHDTQQNAVKYDGLENDTPESIFLLQEINRVIYQNGHDSLRVNLGYNTEVLVEVLADTNGNDLYLEVVQYDMHPRQLVKSWVVPFHDKSALKSAIQSIS